MPDTYVVPARGITLSLLRVIAGGIYIQHGLQKFFAVLGSTPGQLGPLQLTGGIIEVGCGALIILGLLTNYAAFLASGEMAVAYFLFHSPRGFFPVMNHGETPVLLCFVFLYLAFAGGGPYSVDALMRGRPADSR